jgi:2-oxoisovalerate dehydrogenase E2 component (dihydrolipoyl transacylase)
MSAETVFRLPDLGEGLTESEIVEWQVAVGDTVTLNQVIAEVETAKAMVELPSPVAGTVAALHAEEGTVVQVGEPLVTFTASATAPAPAPAELSGREPDSSGSAELSGRESGIPAQGPDSSAAEAGSGANLVGYGTRAARSGRPARRARKPVDPPPAPPSSTGRTGPAHGAEPRHREPAARREPVRSVRRQTAAAMAASATVPQATVHLACDVTASLDLVERLRAHPRTRGVRITVLTVVARAVCLLVPQHLALAAHWVDGDDGPHLEHDAQVDLGIAVATDRGLVVPHVRAADALSAVALARALVDLTATARDARSTPESLRPGTITVTNVGVFGVDAGSPLLNPGETSILALGQIARRPWEHDGEVALRHVVTLSLTFDHRVVDGEQAARFLADLGALLTDPGLALLTGGADAAAGAPDAAAGAPDAAAGAPQGTASR